MNLVIDVGNTCVKVALFERDTLYFDFLFEKKELIKELKKIQKKHKIAKAIISSVATIPKKSIEKLQLMFNLTELDSNTNIPFYNRYATPKTLGVDRIALVSAAVTKFPNKNVLVIDAGTCITYDFVTDKQEYLGGAIAPGLKMRYKSLHDFTANLPLLNPKHSEKLIGNTTKVSIHSGVVNGVLCEIDGIIAQYKRENKNLTIVLTGGDTYFLLERLKSSIFANPNFLLEGLNEILIYNNKND